MKLFETMSSHGYGELHLRRDSSVGLAAIVAIHDTRLGPALGGCRMISYTDEDAALTDAIRLARGMTYKAAITGLRLGGGKSVIMKPAGTVDRTGLFRSFGRFIQSLGGRYITAEDSGTSIEDMEIIRSETRHVTGVGVNHGGSGDPSPWTALGVRRGIEACVKHRLGKTSLTDVRVAVQGVGNVGYHLCKDLASLGARLVVTDVDAARVACVVKECGATAVRGDEIFDVDADVFAPCALGAILHDDTIARLKVSIVAGAANNQLAESRHGEALMARGIVYAPDYAINAGGLVNVAHEITGYNIEAVRSRVNKIHDTIFDIVERAAREKISSHVVADRMAEEALARATVL